MDLLAEMSLGQWLLGLVIFVVCVLLIIVILLQRGRGGGLAGAFGGGGGSSAFGAKTGDVFTWITVTFTGVFILLAIFAGFIFDRSDFALANPQTAQPAPGATPMQIPTEDGEVPQGIKAELVTEDGKTIPINAKLKEGTEETPAPEPGNAPAPAGDSATPKSPDEGGGTNDAGAGNTSDDASNDSAPGSAGADESTSDSAAGDEDPGR